MKLRIVRSRSKFSHDLFLVDQGNGEYIAKVYGHDGQDVEGNAEMIVQGVGAMYKSSPVADAIENQYGTTAFRRALKSTMGKPQTDAEISNATVCPEPTPENEAIMASAPHADLRDKRSTSAEPAKEETPLPYEPLPVNATSDELCPECKGFGFTKRHPKKCPPCKGTGHRLVYLGGTCVICVTKHEGILGPCGTYGGPYGGP